MTDLKINNTYSFQLYGTPTLPKSLKNARLEMMMGAADAAKLADIYSMHVASSASLPPGTPQDVSTFSFYKFRSETNAEIIVADAWIDMATVVKVSTGVLTITLNGVTASDRGIILDAINARGYSVSRADFVGT